MKRLSTILLLIVLAMICAGQTFNVDTLLLIDTNAVSKGKLYYLRISGDSLFLNSDTIISAGESYWYESAGNLTVDYHVDLDLSIVSSFNGAYFGNNGSVSGFDTSAYLWISADGGAKIAGAMAALQSGVPTFQLTTSDGDQGSSIYLQPGYLSITTDSLPITAPVYLSGELTLVGEGIIRTPENNEEPISAAASIYIYGGNGDPDGGVFLNRDENGGYRGEVFVGLVNEENTSDSILTLDERGAIGWTSRFSMGGPWTLTGNYIHQVDYTDSVGVGISTPEAKLHVNGNIRLGNSANPIKPVIYNDEYPTNNIQFDVSDLKIGADMMIVNNDLWVQDTFRIGNYAKMWANESNGLLILQPDTSIKIIFDSLYLDSLIEQEAPYFLVWDNITGQVFAMDTTGWRGGGTGNDYWTWVDAATDTLYNTKSGMLYFTTDVLTDFIQRDAKNTKLGIGALVSTTATGDYNTAIGNNALKSVTVGESNVAIGYNAMYADTFGWGNIGIGREALRYNLSGYLNTAIGYRSMYLNTTSNGNAALGNSSLYSNTSGTANTAIGAYSTYSNTEAHYNTAAGNQALYYNETGNFNTVVGMYAMYGTNTKSQSGNSAFGYSSLRSIGDHGDNNLALGSQSGFSNVTGDANIFIGYQAGYFETGSNKLYIENTNSATPLIYGDFASDSLRFNGSVTITDFLHLIPTDTEPSPASEGQVYYDLSEHRIKVYNGTAWKAIKWTDD